MNENYGFWIWGPLKLSISSNFCCTNFLPLRYEVKSTKVLSVPRVTYHNSCLTFILFLPYFMLFYFILKYSWKIWTSKSLSKWFFKGLSVPPPSLKSKENSNLSSVIPFLVFSFFFWEVRIIYILPFQFLWASSR